jgi:putative SOS response-associated peptidase YedK
VLADGFYEWQKKTANGKQPYYIRMEDDSPFAFAGLWESWKNGSEVRSATIITTDANEVVAPIHNRMPVILHPEDYELWLDPDFDEKERLTTLLKPYPPEAMEAKAWLEKAMIEGIVAVLNNADEVNAPVEIEARVARSWGEGG